MKHPLASFLPIVLAFTATAVSAAFTYEVVRTGYDRNHVLQMDDQQDLFYTVRISKMSVDLYSADRIDSAGNSPEDTRRGIAKYRYYHVISDEDETTDLSQAEPFLIEETLRNEQCVTRYGYYLGTVHAEAENEIMEGDSDEYPAMTDSAGEHNGEYGGDMGEADPLELLKWGHYDPEAANLDWNARKTL